MAYALQQAGSNPEMREQAQLLAGDANAFEQIIRTHNQRLFRIARSILKDAFEAEDIVQEAYIKAFTKLDSLKPTKELGAWLARVTSNLAIDRLRQRNRNERLNETLVDDSTIQHFLPSQQGGTFDGINEENIEMSPEHQTSLSQVRKLLEAEIDQLEDGFREVFVLRLVEGMSVAETAEILDLSPQTVKSRLHRARAKIQNSIRSQLTAASLKVFPFAGVHCDRITAKVLLRLENTGVITSTNIRH